MRTIKFRAWDKSKMIYIGSPRNDTSLIISEECWNVIDHFTGKPIEIANDENSMLMQFTGLVDKNGKEIYEGDIIQFNWGKESKEGIVNSVVEFQRGMFVYNPMKSKQVSRGEKWDQPHNWCDSRWFCGQTYPLCSGFYGYGSCEEYPSNKCKIEVIGNIYENKSLLDG